MTTSFLTPTNNLEESITFYEKLNFSVTRQDKRAFAMSKDLLIEIDANRYIRAGLKLYNDDWAKTAASLEKLVHVTSIENGYLLSDTNGIRIYLINGKSEKDPSQLHELPPPVLGNFAGLSIESTDVKKSLDIYSLLGYGLSSGSIDQGWLTIQNDEKSTLSIMSPNACPHLFFNPSLTFFNGTNNLAIIDKIRALNIPITEEITQFNKEGIVDNIIIRDPGGYGFFIFND